MTPTHRWTRPAVFAMLLAFASATHAASAPTAGDSTGVRVPVVLARPIGAAPSDSGPRRVRMSMPPVQTQGDTARVAGKLVNGMIAIPITINGTGPFWVCMDTGAMGHLRVNESLASRLGLPEAGRARASDPSGRNPREVKLLRVDSLAIGGVRFGSMIASTMPDSALARLKGVEAILGIDLFADLLLTLDYPRAQLALSRATLPPPDDSTVFAYERDHGAIHVPLHVGEREIIADLDTGNMIAPFVFPTEFALDLPHTGEPRSGGTARTVSQTMEIQIITLDVPIRLGALAFASPDVAFPSVHPGANIGSKALAPFKLELDQRSKRLRLARTR